MNIRVLVRLRNWDYEHQNDWMSRDDFKQEIDEDNNDLIDQWVRELVEVGYVELHSGVGAYFHDIRITRTGRDFLAERNA